jgi:hypothetical protein
MADCRRRYQSPGIYRNNNDIYLLRWTIVQSQQQQSLEPWMIFLLEDDWKVLFFISLSLDCPCVL